MEIQWLGHASFKIKGKDNFAIYIDPYNGPEDSDHYSDIADVILVSQHEYDHFDMARINKIKVDSTSIITTRWVSHMILGSKPIDEGEEIEEKGAKIKAIKVAHVDDIRQFKVPDHVAATTKAVGFLIEFEGKRIYFAADTMLFPEMKDIRCDVALIPIGGSLTMDVFAAIKAVKLIKPKVVIPMEWGKRVGDDIDAKHFVDLCRQETGVHSQLLQDGEKYEY